jgi:putative redox protein
MHELNTTWNGNMSFEAMVNGHKLILDAEEHVGGLDLGPRPKPLLIVALTGCTGMDVVSILKKMQVNLDYFNIKAEYEMTEEHPKTFTKIHLIYQFKGDSLPQEKLDKAIKLSQERYCGVASLLSKALELTYSTEIL